MRTWLAQALTIVADEISVEIAPGGRSNLTFFVEAGGHSLMLRRPPLGRRLPTAHNVAREFKVIGALAASAVPVPRALAFCDEENVIGAPFFIMERVYGRFVRGPEECDFTPDEAQRCSRALVRTLAEIHMTPYDELGLGDFGRPDGFLERQVGRWHDQLAAGRARKLPALDELGALLQRRIPVSRRVGIVHGDYRIDNVALDPADPGRVVAVLDWEMATLGDPLTDLGMLLMYWGQPGEPVAAQIQAVTKAPGFLSRSEVVREYEACVGSTLEELDFYVAFAHFKLAVIVEGIYARHLAGQTVGPGFEQIGEIGPVLAERGLELAA